MPEPASVQPAARRWRLLRTLGRVVIFVSVAAVAVDLARRFDQAEVSVHAGWLFVALLPALAGALVQALGFRSLLRALTGQEFPWLLVTSVYLDAQLARYTPGKVGLLAVRVAAAPRFGVSARLMVGSLLIELLSWVGVGVLVGAATLALTSLALPDRASIWGAVSGNVRGVAVVMAGLSLLGVLGLCLVPRGRFPAFVRVALAVPEAPSDLAGPFVPGALPLWHALHWLCWVLAGGILCVGLGAPWSVAAFGGGVLCLAVVLGFLAVFAPAGAGVREVVISIGTAPLLGPSAALVLGLSARVVSLTADFACWAATRVLARVSRSARHVTGRL